MSKTKNVTRRVFYINVGTLAPVSADKYVEKIAKKFKKAKMFEKHDKTVFIAEREGRGSRVEFI